MEFNIELHSLTLLLEFDENCIENIKFIYKDHPGFDEIEKPINNLIIIQKNINNKKELYLNPIKLKKRELKSILEKSKKNSDNSEFLSKASPLLKQCNQLKLGYINEIKEERISEQWKENHKKINEFMMSQLMTSKGFDLTDSDFISLYKIFIKFVQEQITSSMTLNTFVRFMIYFQYSYLFDYYRKSKTFISDNLCKQYDWLNSDNLRVEANIQLLSAIKYACQEFIKQKEESSFGNTAKNASNKFYPFFKVEITPIKNVFNIILLEAYSLKNLQNYKTEYVVNEVNKLFKRLHDDKMRTAKVVLLNCFKKNQDKKNVVSTAESCLYNEISKIEPGFFKFENENCNFYPYYFLKYIANKGNSSNGAFVNNIILFNSNEFVKSNLEYLNPLFQYVVIFNVKKFAAKMKAEFDAITQLNFYEKRNLVPFNSFVQEIIRLFKKYSTEKKQKHLELLAPPKTKPFNQAYKIFQDARSLIGEGPKLREDKIKNINVMIDEIEKLEEKSPMNVYIIVKRAYDNISLSSRKHKLINVENIQNEPTLMDSLDGTLSLIKKYLKV
jgi:hypothetical protein